MLYGYALIAIFTEGLHSFHKSPKCYFRAGVRFISRGQAWFFLAQLSNSLTLIYTESRTISNLTSVPKVLSLEGRLLYFMWYILRLLRQKFGRGNGIFMILLGQIISAAIIDHYRLLDLIQKPITFIKTVGLVYMALRVWLTHLNATTTGLGN